MKVDRNKAERALDAPTDAVRLFLLHGPDEAGSHALARRLERAMGTGAERIDLDSATLKADPARLADEAAALSMFGDKRWIRILPATEDMLPAVQALIETPRAGNPVVALAGTLKGNGALLKLAIADPAIFAVASYLPDGAKADQLALHIGREKGLRLSPDIAQRIARATGGDRALMAGELEKLALYLDIAPERPGDVTHEAVDAVTVGASEEQMGVLVNAVLGGDLATLDRELTALRALGGGGGSMTAALRALVHRASLIASIRAQYDRSGNMKGAIQSAGKAVFWKDEAAVARQVRIWSAERLARLIRRLSDAERTDRSTLNPGDMAAAQEMLAIARVAARQR